MLWCLLSDRELVLVRCPCSCKKDVAKARKCVKESGAEWAEEKMKEEGKEEKKETRKARKITSNLDNQLLVDTRLIHA